MERSEAIEIVRKNWPDGRHQLSEALETLIPELKESEDERIRKAILELVKQSSHILNPMNQKSMIAWLEKQGSQNLANSAKTCKDEQNQPTKYTLEQAARIFLDTLSDTPYNNKPITDAQVITKELLKFLSDAHSYNPNAINEQNPAWSEKDEETAQRIVDTIMKYAISPHSIINGDKPNLEYAQEFESWLKSLKFRIQPQWKPSDEQMTALSIIKDSGNSHEHEVLDSLYYDLKKLK